MKKDITRLLAEPETWDKTGGGIMDCDESIIVLRENLLEIRNICQEALEDAILMEVSEDGGKVAPSMVLTTDWQSLLISYLVLAVITAATVLWLAWLSSRIRLQRVLRMGEA